MRGESEDYSYDEEDEESVGASDEETERPMTLEDLERMEQELDSDDSYEGWEELDDSYDDEYDDDSDYEDDDDEWVYEEDDDVADASFETL